MWFRYKHKWASGIENNWTYLEYDKGLTASKEDAEGFIQNMRLCDEGNWSDKYRGIDYQLIEIPPKEWLEKEIKRDKRRIESIKKRIDRMYQLL